MAPILPEHLERVRLTAARLQRRLPASACVQIDDLYGAGLDGLARAAKSYRAGPVCLWTYAQHRVKGMMLDYLRSLDVRPESEQKRLRKAGEFSHQSWESLDDHELACPLQIEQAAIGEQRAERVRNALRELKEPYRSILWLEWIEELQPPEIAQRLGVSTRRIRSAFKLQHATLRIRLSDLQGVPALGNRLRPRPHQKDQKRIRARQNPPRKEPKP